MKQVNFPLWVGRTIVKQVQSFQSIFAHDEILEEFEAIQSVCDAS